MRPTSPRSLALLATGFAVLGYLLAERTVGRLELPLTAPAALIALAVAEAVLARTVRDRLSGRRTAAGRPVGRPLHPLQVARAAALAKATSPAAAGLLGGYSGLTAWSVPRRSMLPAYAPQPIVAALSALSCLALVIAALLLERACRTPPPPEEPAPPD